MAAKKAKRLKPPSLRYLLQKIHEDQVALLCDINHLSIRLENALKPRPTVAETPVPIKARVVLVTPDRSIYGPAPSLTAPPGIAVTVQPNGEIGLSPDDCRRLARMLAALPEPESPPAFLHEALGKT